MGRVERPTPLTLDALYALVGARRGHFVMESGLHSTLWLDLDALFASPKRVAPFVEALAASLRDVAPDVVCGPLLGGAFLAQSVASSLGAEFWYTERAATNTGDGLYQAQYHLPPAFHERARDGRVVIVDDVMSAGSSLRATYASLESLGAKVVAVGALLVLGQRGEQYFDDRQIPVHAVLRDEFEMWPPGDCPTCASDA